MDGKDEKKPNLFQVLNRGFFNLFLSNSDQEKNYDYLTVVDEMFQGRESVPREDLVRGLEQYIRVHYSLVSQDGHNAYADEASEFVRYLKDNGWLESSQGDDWTEYFTETEGFTKIMPVLKELAVSDYSVPEYTRYLLGLKDDIANFDYANATNEIEEIESYSDSLDRSLKTVNQKLKRFIRNSIEEHGDDPKSIVHDLLYDYKETAPYLAFQNLTVKNNYNASRTPILQGIDALEQDENVQRIVEDYLKTKGKTDEKEAEAYVRSVLDRTYELIHNLDATINGISAKNREYVDEAVRKAKLEYADFKDIEGDIRKVYKELEGISEEEWDSHEEWGCRFPDYRILSQESLLSPAKALSLRKAVEYEPPKRSAEAEQEALDILRVSEAYNEEAVFAFFLNALGRKRSMNASEILLQGEDDLIKLLLGASYSTSPDSPILISPLGKEFDWGDYVIDDFRIEKKEKRHEPQL